ncbi:hypothetical protein PIROE2DRAFT_4685 [Piromyces sp. E2]|nr:hypothetical protein PIROE2DRAFT_4685 [Piromyces sp. E2]|eukprot:OUM67740.1 hypothetical protein PIROE2DRAFT_4685 [Piromyces sp. E2]
MKLLQWNKLKNIDIDDGDELMKECSNNIISITSLPVLFSNIQGLYENSDDKLLKSLANNDLKLCSELQKDFISDVYLSPLNAPPGIANERVDKKLNDKKLCQSIYVVLLSFLEDIVRFYRVHSSEFDDNQKKSMCNKIESIIKYICEKIKVTSPTRTLCEKGLQIVKNFEEIDVNDKEQMMDASALLEELLKESNIFNIIFNRI